MSKKVYAEMWKERRSELRVKGARTEWADDDEFGNCGNEGTDFEQLTVDPSTKSPAILTQLRTALPGRRSSSTTSRAAFSTTSTNARTPRTASFQRRATMKESELWTHNITAQRGVAGWEVSRVTKVLRKRSILRQKGRQRR